MDARPKVKLIGEDGNVFYIIGKASKALRSTGGTLADEFADKALAASSYDEVLQLVHQYVEVY